MRRRLSFIGGGECCDPGALTESIVESDIQRQIRDRFDDECPYSLTRKSVRNSPRARNCNSQVWQVAVNTVAKKRDTLRRSVSSVFRSMNNLRTGFKVAAQVYYMCIVGSVMTKMIMFPLVLSLPGLAVLNMVHKNQFYLKNPLICIMLKVRV